MGEVGVMVMVFEVAMGVISGEGRLMKESWGRIKLAGYGF